MEFSDRAKELIARLHAEDEVKSIVEAGATALAEAEDESCFRPLHDDAHGQDCRDRYRARADVVIAAARPLIEAPLRAEIERLRRALRGIAEYADGAAYISMDRDFALTTVANNARQALGRTEEKNR